MGSIGATGAWLWCYKAQCRPRGCLAAPAYLLSVPLPLLLPLSRLRERDRDRPRDGLLLRPSRLLSRLCDFSFFCFLELLLLCLCLCLLLLRCRLRSLLPPCSSSGLIPASLNNSCSKQQAVAGGDLTAQCRSVQPVLSDNSVILETKECSSPCD